MQGDIALLLFGAGLLGGAVNAIAGGATLFTFPAMMAAGLPPIVANASNATAAVFGNAMGAWSERSLLPPRGNLAALIVAAVVGGAIGAVLLLVTPEKTFTLIVPALIGIATLIFAFAKPLQRYVAGVHAANADHATLRALLVGPAAIYGGYFGAGLGVVLMSIFGATSSWELRSANALKNMLGSIANFAAIGIFIAQGVVSWPETLVMLLAALAGGFVGGRLLRILPAAAVRSFVIFSGALMTAVYVYHYWV